MHLQMNQGTLLSGPASIIIAPAEIQRIRGQTKKRVRKKISANLSPTSGMKLYMRAAKNTGTAAGTVEAPTIYSKKGRGQLHLNSAAKYSLPAMRECCWIFRDNLPCLLHSEEPVPEK